MGCRTWVSISEPFHLEYSESRVPNSSFPFAISFLKMPSWEAGPLLQSWSLNAALIAGGIRQLVWQGLQHWPGECLHRLARVMS